ncbi:MAG: hypothetical protein HPY55_07180 [Firmicutes bacterium]|nr:hypothetical protein [Bacillota bacterium]
MTLITSSRILERWERVLASTYLALMDERYSGRAIGDILLQHLSFNIDPFGYILI